ncbi:XRE family transcriptional regulator [Rhodoferax sp. TH121]|uniref:XRE family transcriptional regulator n=1 Tax=Rhodoferax sp. TH121 TaxID=2022803 RepID=UPI00159549D6|nr:XRE family transcriptional regulator [Rhodoferax sp. TH121]
MTAKRVSGKEMAAFCGVTPGAVSGWFATGRISKDKLLLVANRLDVSVEDLISGTGDHEEPKRPIELSDNPDYPAIRRVSLKAQAGVTGYAVDYMNDDGPPIVFRKDWYTLHGYRPEKMMALRVAGESMVPSLYAGDLIVINSLQTEPKDGIAFVCIYEGEVVVKRLVRDSGQWWLTSDNADQRRHPRKACDDSTQIVGEVVYRQTERI